MRGAAAFTGLVLLAAPRHVEAAEAGGGVLVVNTWFAAATQVAYDLAAANFSAMDCVEAGSTYCEVHQCDTTVGWGNHPDSTGEVTLDAIIMDGFTLNVGAVGYLRRVRGAITAARRVLHYSTETILTGDGATNFSAMTGMAVGSLSSPASDADYSSWLAAGCQPTFYANWEGVNTTCPPFAPIPTPAPAPMPPALTSGSRGALHRRTAVYGAPGKAEVAAALPTPKPPSAHVSRSNHDTIGMCVLDAAGNFAAGGSSNGADHKVAGR